MNSTALMAVSGMFLIFAALENLFVKTIEDQSKGILVNGGCATISKHEIDEVVEASLLCNLITFVLQHVRLEVKNVKWGRIRLPPKHHTHHFDGLAEPFLPPRPCPKTDPAVLIPIDPAWQRTWGPTQFPARQPSTCCLP